MDGNDVGGAALVGVGADLLRRLLGPAADEAGAWMADWIKTRRLASLIAAVKQAISDLEAHDVDWHVVDWKVAFPILEGASLERDDDIVAMWGHLLDCRYVGASPCLGRRYRHRPPCLPPPPAAAIER